MERHPCPATAMSSVYIQEPNTTGKVLIHTSYGDLEVELWCKEAPLACRNFIQLAMEGYYDETIFHRLVPRFIVQAGDPTGTGTGGESIYGAPFKVERHSRLSFSRRGILGMASVTSDGMCSSQFFFTLDQGTELDRTNTVFGRVVGDTIYNLVRIGEIEVDKVTERPLFPPKIVSIQIVLNPFEDMMPRDLPEVRERLAKLRPKPAVQKPAAVAIKNKTLLSFQDDEEEQDANEVSTKIMSSHDFLNDPHLSKQRLNLENTTAKPVVALKPETKGPTEYELIKKEQKEQLKSIEESIASVQSDLRSMGHAAEPVAKKAKKDSVSALLGRKTKSTSLLEEQRAMYKEKANAIVGKRPKDKVEDVNTLLTLNAFKEKLLSVNHVVGDLVDASAPEPTKILDICKLHGLVNCLSCRDTFGFKEDGAAVGEEGWLMHRLVFDKEEGYKELRQELTNFVVIDPREKEKEIMKGKTKR